MQIRPTLAMLLVASAAMLTAQDRIVEWKETTPLPFENVHAAKAVTYQNHVLVFAFDGRSYVGDVQANGTIPAWRQSLGVPNLNPQVQNDPWATPCVVGDYVVIPGSPVSLVSRLGSSGDILSWTNGPGVTPHLYMAQTAVCSGNRVYVLGH